MTPEHEQLPGDERREGELARSGLEPHPEREEGTEAGAGRRGGLIAAVVIGVILLIVVVLHLAGGMTFHGG